MKDHRDAWEIVRCADHPTVGLVLDGFHRLARRIDPKPIRLIPRDRIFLKQLAPAPRIEIDLLYRSRHFRNMPGAGDLPVTEFMRAVAATGCDGPISLEIFNDRFRGGRPQRLPRDGYRSLVALPARQGRRAGVSDRSPRGRIWPGPALRPARPHPGCRLARAINRSGAGLRGQAARHGRRRDPPSGSRCRRLAEAQRRNRRFAPTGSTAGWRMTPRGAPARVPGPETYRPGPPPARSDSAGRPAGGDGGASSTKP